MLDAQTEARAIQRYIAPSAGRGAVVQLLEHCDGEWVRYKDHAAALAAKDTELAKIDAHRRKVIAENERLLNALIDRYRQLAEAHKALVIANAQLDNMEFLSVEGFMDWQQEYRAARRAREAQGGENG